MLLDALDRMCRGSSDFRIDERQSSNSLGLPWYVCPVTWTRVIKTKDKSLSEDSVGLLVKFPHQE
jgi:hypothetical protein